MEEATNEIVEQKQHPPKMLVKNIKMVPIDSIRPHPDNPRRGDIAAIKASIEANGFFSALLVQQSTGHILAGSHRWVAAKQLDMLKVPVMWIDVDNDRAKRILLADNRINDFAKYDDQDLDNLLKELAETEIGLTGTGFSDEEFDAIMSDMRSTVLPELPSIRPALSTSIYEVAVQEADDRDQHVADAKDNKDKLAGYQLLKETEKEQRGVLTIEDVPDAIFPSNNQFQIPTLDLEMQAQFVEDPVVLHGGLRKPRAIGTLFFYTDDYRFLPLVKNPTYPVNKDARSCAELNISVTDSTTVAEAIWRTYQKRWVARYWQTMGIRIFVDLYTGDHHKEINLLGVPVGWRAYATVAYKGCTVDKGFWSVLELAQERAGTEDILLLVYAGGNEAKALCEKHTNWVYVPHVQDIYRGKDTFDPTQDGAT